MAGRSLLDFLDAPVVVGDPDGRAVYVNPAFEAGFSVSRDEARGRSLATLFEGGAREAILGAVAGVCSGSSTRRFRLRVGDAGYAAQASPIESEQGRVGVMILLTEELEGNDRAREFQREIQEPFEVLAHCLEQLLEESSSRSERRCNATLEEALRALELIRERMVERQGPLDRSGPSARG